MRFVLFVLAFGFVLAAPAIGRAAVPSARNATPSPVPAVLHQLRFRNVGPQVSGGRVGSVTGTDLDSSLYYAGAAGGGVWKTTNAGQSFSPVFDKQDVGSIGSIAIDPKNENVVWVGTGEGAPRNDVSQGDGVYRTADGGKTWDHVLVLRSALIAGILVDPNDSNTVLVGVLGDPFSDSTDRGMYRTTDGGKTWSKTLYIDARTGVSDLDNVPEAAGTVYAGMWPYRRTGWSSESGGTQGGLYKSSDFGVTWQRLNGNGLPSGPTGRIGIAIAPSNTQRIYALIESKAGLLWRSDDGGASWRMVNDSSLIDERPFYYTHVFVDPTNENHVWTLSVHTTVSFNGGETFRIGARGIHGDNHSMWISRDAKRIIEGNDGGPAFSYDNGRTWAMPHDLPIAQLYHLGFDRTNPYHVCAPLQDNGIWCAPNNGLSGSGISSSQWHNEGGGDGTWVMPDPIDPRIIWTTSGGGNIQGELMHLDTRTNETVYVQPYLHDQNVVDPKDLKYRFNWETPFAFDPFDGHRIWVGGDAVFTSTDRGANWHTISGDLTRNVKAHELITGGITLDGTGAETTDTILYIEPSSARRAEVWVGTDDGYLQLTRDGGKTWRNVTPPQLAGLMSSSRAKTNAVYGRFPSLSASHRDAGMLFAAYDMHMVGDRTPHVFMTRDYGAHWKDVAGGLPRGQEVRSVRIDPRNASIVYAGVENGLWVSFDRGSHWRNLNLNMPAVSVRDIQVHPVTDDLMVATHGRGVYILDDLTPLQEWQRSRRDRLFAIRPAYQWNLHRYYGTHDDGAAPPYGAIITYYLNHAVKNVTAEIVDERGRTIRHFSGKELTGQAGFNRFSWDATEDKPVDWRFAPTWNSGFDAGAPVLPGKYAIVLHAANEILRGSVVVRQDPRTQYTAAQLLAGQAAMRGLYGDFNRVDVALNVLSTVLNEAPLRVAALRSQGRGALALRVADIASQAKALLLTITQNPVNDQDNDFLTDILRERLQSEIDYASNSFGPPPASQIRENAALLALTNDRMRSAKAFDQGRLRAVDAELRAVNMPALTTLTKAPHIYNENGGGDRRGAGQY